MLDRLGIRVAGVGTGSQFTSLRGFDCLAPQPLAPWGALSRNFFEGVLVFLGRKINLSQVCAGQRVGIKQVDDRLWLVSFMDYDLGYVDDTECRLEPLDNPFGAKLLPMSPE
jgi:hypothetical protein